MAKAPATEAVCRAVDVVVADAVALPAPGGVSLLTSDYLDIRGSRDAGILFEHEFYGSFLLDPEGTEIRCAPAALAPWVWQRFLVAQLLPTAALVQGLQPMHASGVVIEGRAVLLLGTSGSGKTTTCLTLSERGAGFLCDDVAALEVRGGRVRAFAGSSLVSIDARGREMSGSTGLEELGVLEGESRCLVAGKQPDVVPLGGLALLTRDREVTSIEERREVEWPSLLLGSHFSPLLARFYGAEAGWLETCQATTEAGLVALAVPYDADPNSLADVILRRFGQGGGPPSNWHPISAK